MEMDRSAFSKKFMVKGVLLAIAATVIIILVYFPIKAIGGITVSPEIEAWLNAPISQLKTWHLIAIVYIASVIGP